MAQNITLKIAGKEYSILAPTPELEAKMRTAAADVNQRFKIYDAKFVDRTLEDKLAFVALNEGVGRLSAQDGAKALVAEAKELEDRIGSYLEGIEINR